LVALTLLACLTVSSALIRNININKKIKKKKKINIEKTKKRKTIKTYII